MAANRREPKRKEGGRVRRADICLMAFFLLLALGCFGWSEVNRKVGRTLRISCDGQVIADIPLAQDRQKKTAGEDEEAARYCLLLYLEEGVSCEWYEETPNLAGLVPDGRSYNLLAVSGEHVRMDSADCRDQICVHHRPIAGGGESIICLPHKLVVEIMGGTDT